MTYNSNSEFDNILSSTSLSLNAKDISWMLDKPDTRNAKVQEIEIKELNQKGIRIYIKREDLIHPAISGNKWRKLKYNLEEAERSGQTTILTFGGAYSNHIYAVAAAGKIFGFKTIGVIRGEPYMKLNPTLAFAEQCGMKLHYLTREIYSSKYSVELKQKLNDEFGDFYTVPEGGSNQPAIRGCAEIINEIKDDFDVYCLACGTGGTIAGILEGLREQGFVIGFPILKHGSYLRKNIDTLTGTYSGQKYPNYVLNTKYHFGGYAKHDNDLVEFINNFNSLYGIPLDPVYTGKMMFGILNLAKNGFIKRNTSILAIHTGGLQGIEGFNQRFGGIINC